MDTVNKVWQCLRCIKFCNINIQYTYKFKLRFGMKQLRSLCVTSTVGNIGAQTQFLILFVNFGTIWDVPNGCLKKWKGNLVHADHFETGKSNFYENKKKSKINFHDCCLKVWLVELRRVSQSFNQDADWLPSWKISNMCDISFMGNIWTHVSLLVLWCHLEGTCKMASISDHVDWYGKTMQTFVCMLNMLLESCFARLLRIYCINDFDSTY